MSRQRGSRDAAATAPAAAPASDSAGHARGLYLGRSNLPRPKHQQARVSASNFSIANTNSAADDLAPIGIHSAAIASVSTLRGSSNISDSGGRIRVRSGEPKQSKPSSPHPGQKHAPAKSSSVSRPMNDQNSNQKKPIANGCSRFEINSDNDKPEHTVTTDINNDRRINSLRTSVSRWDLFGSSKPELHYTFNPPAAPKYFLWDSTPIGPTVPLDTSRLAIASIRIHACAYRRLTECLSSTNSASATEEPDFIGFFLGRVMSSDILGFSPGTSSQVSRNRTVNLAASDFVVSSNDGAILLRKVIVLDRFDLGRKGTDKNFRPSITLNGDVAIKIYKKSAAAEDCSFSFSAYNAMIEETNANLNSAIFPTLLELDMHKNIMTARQIVPSFKLHPTPINSLRIVPTKLSLSLMQPELEPEADSIDFGYTTIDQARHILFLAKNDKAAWDLPLIGMWFKNAESSCSLDVQHIIAKFLSDTRYKRLDIGRRSILLVLITPSAQSTRTISRVSAANYAADVKPAGLEARFFECDYEPSATKFSVYGNSSCILSQPPISFDDDGNHQAEEDIVCMVDMQAISVVHEKNLIKILDEHFDIKVNIPDVPDNKSFSTPITTSNAAIDEEDDNLSVNFQTENEFVETAQPESPETPTEDVQSTVNPSKTPSTTTQPPVDALQLMQQQQLQFYLLFMQQQYKMMMALADPLAASSPALPLLPGTISSHLHMPTMPGTVTDSAHNIKDNSDHNTVTPPMQSQMTSICSSTRTATMRTIGTNTSFAFNETVFQTLQHQKNDATCSLVLTPGIKFGESDINDLVMPQMNPERTVSADSIKLSRKHSSCILPPDTGTNYQLLYTYESIPVEAVEESQHLPGVLPGPPSHLQSGQLPASLCSSRKPPTYRNHLLPAGRIMGNLQPENIAVDKCSEIDYADAAQTNSSKANCPSQPLALRCQPNEHKQDLLSSLDLSQIQGDFIGGNETFDGTIEDIHGNSNNNNDNNDNSNSSNNSNDEHTRELIALLVQHPEQSFILCDPPPQPAATAHTVYDDYRHSNPHAAVPRSRTAPNHAQLAQARDAQSDRSFDESKKPGDDPADGSTHEQFSKATLAYLAKYGIV
ncbi:hypothetical protein HDU84_000544 [Entophlyctis sp. JEL0112]|nr:hypothetical protein HDU84_000544 [Entophlyctis sp. JEL0112]